MNISFSKSPRNKVIKKLNILINSKSKRFHYKKTILEGRTLLLEYIRHFGLYDTHIILSKKTYDSGEIIVDMGQKEGNLLVLSDSLFDRVSERQSSQGVLAIVPIQCLAGPWQAEDKESIILLDGVQEPGNVGAIIRLAAAFKIRHVLLTKGSCDPWSPKCLRGGMGAQFIVNCEEVISDDVLTHFSGGVVGMSSSGKQSISEFALSGKMAYVFGSEGAGISSQILKKCSSILKVPTSDSVESLNVASCVAIVLYERQKYLLG